MQNLKTQKNNKMASNVETQNDNNNKRKRTVGADRSFLGLCKDRQAFVDSLPKIKLATVDPKKLKFHGGMEAPSSQQRYLFAGYDKKMDMVYGHVRMYENEWGTIDVDDLQKWYEKTMQEENRLAHITTGLFPFVETFKDGPKTLQQLEKLGWDFEGMR